MGSPVFLEGQGWWGFEEVEGGWKLLLSSKQASEDTRGGSLCEGTEDGGGEAAKHLVLDIDGDIHLAGGSPHNLLDIILNVSHDL